MTNPSIVHYRLDSSLASNYARLGMLSLLPRELPLKVPSIHLATRRQRALSPAADFEQQIRAAPVNARTGP